jgi:hypothetical protein
VKWFFLGVYFLLACDLLHLRNSQTNQMENNNKEFASCKPCNFLFQVSLEIEISHLNWDFPRFPWYFSIGLTCTNKVELPIVKHTLMIKYLCISLLISWFFRKEFSRLWVCQILGHNTSESSIRQRRTKKSMKRMICANQKMFEKKSIRPRTLRPYLPDTLFVLMSDLKGYGCTNLRFTKISFEL